MLINNTINNVLRNIDDANAPTFDGKTIRFCYTSFLNLLENRVLRAGGRTYTICLFNKYEYVGSELDEEVDEPFGEFLADRRVYVKLNQSGTDLMASFVDLCL